MPSPKPDPLDDILALLRAGAFSRAIPLLVELSRSQPQRADVHFNLGLALSETQQFPEALIALKRCVDLDPSFQPAWVAVGVAYARKQQYTEAKAALAEALKLNPDDGLTLLNLSGVLGHLGEHEMSAETARRAVSALPGDVRALWNLAQSLKDWSFDPRSGDLADKLRSEAAEAYKLLLERHPDSPMAEGAERALTLIAESTLRARGLGPDGFRPDVFEYIVHALRMFEEMGADRRNRVVLEIAKVGAEGLNINSPERRHAVKGLPGNYTALQLVAFLYTGMQQVNPSVSTGVDFSQEYQAALEFTGRTDKPTR
jgi:tetratricopeptide (TPR) repeat protein